MIGRTLSHYRIQEEISRGGMGVVYRALDTKLDREIALKILPAELVADESRRRRFVQEAKAAAAIHHPHIATIHEIDDAEGVHFIVMELIQGEMLSALLARGRLPVSRTLELAMELAEGLSKAHEMHVVHRDLKPANVMVTEDGHVKIIDFGLAKLVEPFRPLAGGESEAETGVRGATEPGQILGTVSYMSPEQARGEGVDHRSDIFSFGVVLYEMLTGGLPWGSTKIYVKQVAGGRPVALTEDLAGEHRFPQWTPDGTRIAFQSDLHDGSVDMYVVPALGGAPRRFPTAGYWMEQLVWSPNGELVAYPTASAIFVGPADGGEARKLTDAVDPSCLIWSPDGTRIAFTSGNLGYLRNLNVAPSSIWVVDVERGEAVRVTEGEHVDFSPVWTPDGKSLLFVSDRGGSRDIYRISVGSDSAPVSAPERLSTGLDVFTMASSADGRMLSYSVATLRQNIWSLPVPPDGAASLSGARPVTTGNQVIEAVGVSADGEWLAFGSDQGGEASLFKMPVGGREPVQLTTAPTIGMPSWSPDRKEIAFHTFRTDNRDIFVIPAEGGSARQITSHPAHEFYPHWSPDGTRLVFHSSRTGVPEIYVVSKDEGELSGETPVQLTFDGWGIAPRWSPDGRLIAYESRSGVSVIPSEGGEPRPLTDFGARPLWSKDSKTIHYIVGGHDQRAGIWSVPTSGGKPSRLVRFDDPLRDFYFDWSGDGEDFYFMLAEFEADVWVMELEDSKE